MNLEVEKREKSIKEKQQKAAEIISKIKEENRRKEEDK